MKVEHLKKENEHQWDSFVEAHSEGRFVHLTAYKHILEETHGYTGHYLFVSDGNEILALFPFFEFQNFFGKTKCISQPFNASGGMLLREDLDKKKKETVIRVLRDFVVDFLHERKAPHVEIHGQIDTDGLFAQNLAQKPMQKIAVLELGAYENVERKFQQRLRKDLRKEEREGVRVYSDTSRESITSMFYPLYTRYGKERHGTPPQPLSLFLSYYQYGKDYMKIFFAERNGKVTAALLGFYVHNRVQLSYNAFTKGQFSKLIHARFIEWACQNNFRYLDFGPGRYPGQAMFKKKWGVEFQDYNYFYLGSAPHVPSRDVTEKRSITIAAWFWKYMMPNFLSKILGPFIRKHIGK